MSLNRSAPSSAGGSGSTPLARRVRLARRWLPRAAIAAAVLLATAGCQSNAFTRMGMPAPITKQAKVVVTMWQGSWIAAWAVGIVVWGAIIAAVIFFRKRSDRVPHQVRYNLPIEILYTVVPFIMIGVLFFFTARDENYIDALPAHPDVVINVTGFQWSWDSVPAVQGAEVGVRRGDRARPDVERRHARQREPASGEAGGSPDLEIRVAHYPPYCSKYNPIEHRMFPHVTRACRGVIFRSLETVRYYVSKTETSTGLTVKVSILEEGVPDGSEVRGGVQEGHEDRLR